MSGTDVYRNQRQAGMEEDLAALVARALGPVATKQDLAEMQRQLTELKSDMAVVKGRLTTGLFWLIGSMTVLLGLLLVMPVLALLPS